MLHAFQGWADKFLSTPSAGIEDLYVSISRKYRGTSYAIDLKYANYVARSFATDTQKLWIMMSASFGL